MVHAEVQLTNGRTHTVSGDSLHTIARRYFGMSAFTQHGGESKWVVFLSGAAVGTIVVL